MSASQRLFAALIALFLVAACSAPASQPPAASGPTTPPVAAAPTSPPAAAPTAAPATAKPAVTPPPVAAATAAPATVAAVAAVATSAPAAATTSQPAAAPKPPTAPVSGEVVVFAAVLAHRRLPGHGHRFPDRPTRTPSSPSTSAPPAQLATQLGQGASADVFASADTDADGQRPKVRRRQRPGQASLRATAWSLITPKDNPAKISSVKDLANDGVKFVTAQPSVPIGKYTAQMLDKATADPSLRRDFKTRSMANTVSQEDNVRQVVSKVQLGEADAAVVYSTDATPQVRDQLQHHPGARRAADAGDLSDRRGQGQ